MPINSKYFKKHRCEFLDCLNEYKYLLKYRIDSKERSHSLCFSCWVKCVKEAIGKDNRIGRYSFGNLVMMLIKDKNGNPCNYEIFHQHKASAYNKKVSFSKGGKSKNKYYQKTGYGR